MSMLRDLFAYQFMVNAFRAGTIVAVVASAMGWFMVLRRQTFAGHTLAVVGFPGAAGATLLGITPAFGYFAFCGAAALVIAGFSQPDRAGYSDESAVTGSVQALLLASGFLFVSLYAGNLNGLDALLFGSFLGITSGQVLVLLCVAAPTILILGVIARPLLFASLDPEVAAAAGVPVRLLSIAFLLLLGMAVAEASQITGALLVFALLVLPAAAAQALTSRALPGLVLAMALAVLVTWFGLAIAYYSPYPTGVFITSLAFGVYVIARVVAAVRRRNHRTIIAASLAAES